MIKNLSFDSLSKKIILNDYSIFYSNEESAKQTIAEALDSKQYEFASKKGAPFIIDCGSEIGIATFLFKIQYPNAKIICFEPEPFCFSILKKNIEINQLQNITLVNAALSKHEGMIDFFGQVNVQNPDTRGNSIISSWGLQRESSKSIKVKTVKLSSYIDDDVDFLKLDVEAAEQQILEELGSKLNLIREITLEVHQNKEINEINNLDTILSILKKYNFNIDLFSRNADLIWPQSLEKWVIRTSPLLYIVKAKNKSFK